ncbi:inositol hexakisphosphate-domain-containing protein [Roridomyces roridus]|uniref:Inositol hexakisphosphate-domain-containing protein n=1 Tax=Roridomyces roridus TaxID=1738132 RepID=A0AAD7CI39_9AGAR|nr:inositol hexakisphosphate-domain-containing protein [Roridomyces roridus]
MPHPDVTSGLHGVHIEADSGLRAAPLAGRGPGAGPNTTLPLAYCSLPAAPDSLLAEQIWNHPITLNGLHRTSENHHGSVPPLFRNALFNHHRICIDPQAQEPTKVSGDTSLDLMAHLRRAGPFVEKSRTGSVLSRGCILKTDYYPSGRALDLDLDVHGAPNFRAPSVGGLNVFGVAQPRTQGLRAILSVLRCRPDTPDPTHVVWFSTREEPIVYISGRSFVLRDASQPSQILSLSDRAENLEDIEVRMKNDILQEAQRHGGLILTHNEMASDSGKGELRPTWTYANTSNVKTSKEIWGQMKDDGWNVDYHRIPIAPDQPIEDNYLDAYLRVVRNTDPLRTALVFSCGMGAVRSTFAMVAASIVRRKQLIIRGLPDPYASKRSSGPPTPETESRFMQALEQASAQRDLGNSRVRLTCLLQQLLQNQNPQYALLLMTRPALSESLLKAHVGNYELILSLLGCLDHGQQAKKLVDRVIDATDQVINLREDILINYLKYSITGMDEAQREDALDGAVKAMEKYFFAIAFASFVDSADDIPPSFSDWLKTRTEIWNQIKFLRKSSGSRLNVFAPIHDLLALSKSDWLDRAFDSTTGGQVGDEYSTHVFKHRSGLILRQGTFLKSDQWLQKSHHVDNGVQGAINFRRVPMSNIYALGQPTLEAIDEVISRIKDAHPGAQRIIWITLREEPIVYINGEPYCLRRELFSLRNMKDYDGISASRLEVLEENLRDDVVSELKSFGRLLLHTEAEDGTVIPVLKEIKNELDDVVVLKDVMTSRSTMSDVEYHRIPMTAEKPPDFPDLQDLMDVVLGSSTDTPIVVNCQLGRGMSTLASVILLLIRQWLDPDVFSRKSSSTSLPSTVKSPHSYHIINNLLRVFTKGITVKDSVDEAIERASLVYNLIDGIEEARMKAHQATDDKEKRRHAMKGMHHLHRYFTLVVFQAYLQSTEPDTMRSFESIEAFVLSRPVIKTFENELFTDGLDALKPLERPDVTDGVADPDEVNKVVRNRAGIILSASTILKNDMFSNLRKMTPPEHIEGAPNFRQLPLTLRSSSGTGLVPGGPKTVCGSGMPTVEGLRRVLFRLDAGPSGKNNVFWTCLREEAVVYVAGSPHVLRLAENPLENLETTGVTTSMVEQMEEAFKKDVLREVRENDGRVLLHDDCEESPGSSTIVPICFHVDEEGRIQGERFFCLTMTANIMQIDYGRIAITNEQAPLPDALSHLFDGVRLGLTQGSDFVFNCQMGRGRTTTAMVAACLIATTQNWDGGEPPKWEDEEITSDDDGLSEEKAYLQGGYKTILQLVGVLSCGKLAKRLADRAIDVMQDVQNLRKAIYDNKLKVAACEKGSAKERKLHNLTVHYLYRYGSLIVFADYLIELQNKKQPEVTFTDWLKKHPEITKSLGRRPLD